MSNRVAEPKKKGITLEWSRRSSVCAASAASGALSILAFPPVGWWVLAFVAPLPLLWAAGLVRGRRLGAAVAAGFGMAPVWAWQSQWAFGVSAGGALPMVAYLAAYSGAFVWIVSWAAGRLRAPAWLLGPVVWAGLEVLRGEVLWHGYPWLLAGHPLIESAWLSRAGSVVGAYGVSFLALALGMAAFGLVASRGRWRAIAAAMLLGIAGVWAVLSARPWVPTEGVLRVAVVQTNVPQGVKLGWPPAERMRDLDRMLELSVRAFRTEPKPDLIVWPETMFPGAALDPDSLNQEAAANLVWSTDTDTAWPVLRYVVSLGPDGFDAPVSVSGPIEQANQLVMPTMVAADSLLTLQRQMGVPFLVGAEGIDGLELTVDEQTGAVTERHDARFNSSYLLTDGRMTGERYDKMHLTPFGEVMPYISAWPWLERVLLRVGVGAAGMSFDLDAGTKPVTHLVRSDSGLVRVATPICFEGIMPAVCRRLAFSGGQRRADVLIQLTNEGWFGDFDAAREQHLQILRWRALELGTPVVRAANTGISAAIGPDGRVFRRGVHGADTRADGVLWAEAPIATGTTPYAAAGDVLGWASLLGLGGILVAGLLVGPGGRRQSRGGKATDEGGESSQ